MDLFCYLCLSLPYCNVCFLQPFGVICWERADLLALFYVLFSCVFSHGQVWYFYFVV